MAASGFPSWLKIRPSDYTKTGRTFFNALEKVVLKKIPDCFSLIQNINTAFLEAKKYLNLSEKTIQKLEENAVKISSGKEVFYVLGSVVCLNRFLVEAKKYCSLFNLRVISKALMFVSLSGLSVSSFYPLEEAKQKIWVASSGGCMICATIMEIFIACQDLVQLSRAVFKDDLNIDSMDCCIILDEKGYTAEALKKFLEAKQREVLMRIEKRVFRLFEIGIKIGATQFGLNLGPKSSLSLLCASTANVLWNSWSDISLERGEFFLSLDWREIWEDQGKSSGN